MVSLNLKDVLQQNILAVSASLFAIYILVLVFWRLFLHPLAKYPGPKLAALTQSYEFYYDGIKQGRYTFEIGRMHQKYGPIVRIGPNELHVNEPGFIDELYAGGGKVRDKWRHNNQQYGIPESVFSTVSHHQHRVRRGAMNRFFSKAAITRLEPIVHEVVEKLCRQFSTYEGTGKPVIASSAFCCMTTDIITDYAFAKSTNFLDSPTFEPNLHRPIVAGSNMAPWSKRFPWIIPLMQSLPSAVTTTLNPEMGVYVRFEEDLRSQIREINDQLEPKSAESRTHVTMFHELLQGDLPESDKRVERIWQEGQIIVGAGTETTAWALSVTLFYILNDPAVFENLQRELADAIPNPNERVPCKKLESLPYLISGPSSHVRAFAVISEGLRLSYGVSTRLQRINPNGPLRFRSKITSSGFPAKEKEIAYDIPAGTPVGMTSTLIHMHPELFPQPHEFQPARWLSSEGQRKKDLDPFLLSFSKGSRQCIGINLAYAELYLGIGLLVRRLGARMELFETTKDDVEIYRDRVVPMPKDGSKGVRILVRAG